MSIKNSYVPVNLGDTSNEFTNKININFTTTKDDVEYLNKAIEESKIKPATIDILGGIKASAKTNEETVEVKIGTDNKLYVPESGLTEIPQATETALGGIKALPKTDNEMIEVKIGSDSKLYVPNTGGIVEIPQATEFELGGIKALIRSSGYTSEIKIDSSTGKLYGLATGTEGDLAEIWQAIDSLRLIVGKTKTIEIQTTSWTDNKIIITPQQHELGETSQLFIQIQPENESGTEEITYDSPTISTNGTITITTRVPWKGKILIATGFSSGGSADLTEVWKAINDIKASIEVMEVTFSTI